MEDCKQTTTTQFATVPVQTGCKMPTPRTFNGEKYYGTDDVAKIIGVKRQTVSYWHNKGYFTADDRAHDGRYLYTVEHVEQLKSVYRPDWNQPAYLTHVDDNAFSQCIENLPDEIQSAHRFVKTGYKGNIKAAFGQWQMPENWQCWDEIDGYATFVACSDDDDGFVFYDFDHVLDAVTGKWKSDVAKSFFGFLHVDGSYCELSQSRTGLHLFAQLTPKKFPPFQGKIHFDDGSMLEVFYKKPRCCLVTGNLYQCRPGAPIVCGERADGQFLHVIEQARLDKEARNAKKNPQNQSNTVDNQRKELPPEIKALIGEINKAVTPETLKAKGYLKKSANGNFCCPWCGSGNGDNQTGAMFYYSLGEQSHFTCFSQKVFDKEHGGDIVDLLAQVWYGDKHGQNFFKAIKRAADEFGIEYDPKIFTPPENKSSAQIYSLKIKLNEIDKEIDDLDAEKIAALEKLRDVEKFDSKTVFADEVITAAAFARLTDQQAFSDFQREVKIYGDKHKAEKVNVTIWLSDVKDRAAELINRQKSLATRRNKVQAQINSLSFVGKNDLLKGITIPAEYNVTTERGIEKVTDGNVVTVCRRPIVVVEKIYSVDEKIFKLVLAFMTTTGTWVKIPPKEKAIVFNRNRIIDLANSDLPVTSSNAALVVDYLDAFNTLNENKLPLSYFVNRGGWLSVNGKDFFIDPRRETIIDTNGKKISVKVDKSRSEFAQHLKTVGNLDEWKKAYLLAKKAPVARLMVAAAVAPPLLKVLGERNFLLYIYAPTRAGKTTSLYLGTSAVGGKKINRSFDATKNGLAGAAADVNDYCFPVDEKQVADNRISEQLTALVYALGNGVGRTKLNRDSTLKEAKDWRTIAIATGETLLLPDNVTGGANTRLLTVKAPKEILSAADCKVISETIRENYGLAFPLVVEKILQTDRQKLRDMFDQMSAVFEAKYPEILPDHRRYMALLTLADAILNAALFGNEVTTPDGESILTSDDAIINAAKIFPLILTVAEVSDTPREKDFVRSFIGQNQNRFVGGLVDMDRMQAIYGKLKDDDGFTYVSAKALKDACKTEGFDYRKLVADLVADGFFKPADNVAKGHKTPLATVQKKIGAINMRCHRIPQVEFDDCE